MGQVVKHTRTCKNKVTTVRKHYRNAKTIRVKKDWAHSKSSLPLEASERQKMWWQEQQAKTAPLNRVTRTSLKKRGFVKKKKDTTVSTPIKEAVKPKPIPHVAVPHVATVSVKKKKKFWFQKSMNELLAERKERRQKVNP